MFCVLFPSLAALAGCTTVWEESYRPISEIPKLSSGQKISIREVPWERMERAIEDSRQRIVESDRHPSEWSDEEQIAARADLLEALQVSNDPASVQVIGVSSFRTTDVVKPWDGSLVGFARKVGATHVVWADRYLGKAEAIVDRTIYIDRLDFGDGIDADGNPRDRFRSGTTTSTVPVVVNRDERGYTAFFLHIDP